MHSVRLLLADDNEGHRRQILRSLLDDQPLADVVVADSRESVVLALRTQPFDCVILDDDLSPAAAPEVLDSIRALQPEIPRIVISASDEQGVVIRLLRLGVADFLPKRDAVSGPALWQSIQNAIERARMQRIERRKVVRRLEHFEQQAFTDPLTGLQNRRAIEEACVLRGLRDRRQTQGVVLLDIDRFKAINDTHGHDVGDRALRRVAEIIRAQASEGDLCCRWGGEEFVVLRETLSPADLWCWADDLRAAIEREGAEGLPIASMTASIGVAVSGRDEILRRGVRGADQAMYAAKSLGRNRVVTSAMALVHRSAERLAAERLMTPGARLRMLIEGLRSGLGRAQADHVGPHACRVQGVAHRLGKLLDLPAEVVDVIGFAAVYHDIGKLGIPEDLLGAPRRLNTNERRLAQQHARFGADLLELCGAHPLAIQAVGEHHDRFDARDPGRGDPGQPSPGEVLCACDAFVAMMDHRAYAPPLSRAQALAELRVHRGTQFHPEVVDALHFLDTDIAAA